MGALSYDDNPRNQVIGDVQNTMMHESTPLFQHYKPIIEIMVVSKRILIHGDDNALIPNSFVGLMEFYMNVFRKPQTFYEVV
jgi:hypothetical protein